MIKSVSRVRCIRSLAGSLLFGLVSVVLARGGQDVAASPKDLLDQMADGRSGGLRPLVFSCGRETASRDIARELAKSGPDALAEVERAVNSLRLKGQRSPYEGSAHWLLWAYAKLAGTGGFTILSKMAADSKLKFIRGDISDALALALGLSSYLIGGTPPRQPVCRSEQPQDALDRSILTWANGNVAAFEASLDLNGSLLPRSTARRLWELRKRRFVVGYRVFSQEATSERPVPLLADQVHESATHAGCSRRDLNSWTVMV